MMYLKLNDKLTSLKESMIRMWKEKSFAFAFWVVFVFGNIFLGFLVRSSILIVFWMQNNIPGMIVNLPGPFSLRTNILLIYMFFSIIYVYRKSSLLDVKYNKMVCFFLGFYLCSSVIMLLFLANLSFLHFIGGTIYDTIFGSGIEYIFIMLENVFNNLKSAAEIASCK